MHTPEISHALAAVAGFLELTPHSRMELLAMVPAGAHTVADLPENLRDLISMVEQEGSS
jgi:hypothetical protein